MPSINLEESRAEFNSVLVDVEKLFIVRNAQYGDAWKRKDLRDSIMHIVSKSSRLESLMWMIQNEQDGRPNDKDLDDVMDLIVYAVFTVLHIKAGRIIEQNRPSQPRQEELAAESWMGEGME
jgi:hypothetical protein